jgi:hypothetical protein
MMSSLRESGASRAAREGNDAFDFREDGTKRQAYSAAPFHFFFGRALSNRRA